jgi:hypothetical protein
MHFKKRQVGATAVVAFFLNRHFGVKNITLSPNNGTILGIYP